MAIFRRSRCDPFVNADRFSAMVEEASEQCPQINRNTRTSALRQSYVVCKHPGDKYGKIEVGLERNTNLDGRKVAKCRLQALGFNG